MTEWAFFYVIIHMEKFHKPTPLLFVSVFVLTLMVGHSSLVSADSSLFIDVPNDAWFVPFIRQAQEAGIMTGYKDADGHPTGTFGPSAPVTVGELLKIAVEGAGYDPKEYEAQYTPPDCPDHSHWAQEYTPVAYGEKFIFYPDLCIEDYQLNIPVTRAQVAFGLASAFRLDTEVYTSDRYEDVLPYAWYSGAVEVLSADGIISGDTDAEGHSLRRFRPNDPINRAEMAKIVMKARDKYGTPGAGRVPMHDIRSEFREWGIDFTDAGFQYPVMTVELGTTVFFFNESSGSVWIASDPHPAHTDLPGFDSGKALTKKGQSYSFLFSEPGTWHYHNHLNPSQTGSIIVSEFR